MVVPFPARAGTGVARVADAQSVPWRPGRPSRVVHALEVVGNSHPSGQFATALPIFCGRAP